MKFTVIAAVAAGAALVSASPLRVIVVTSSIQRTEPVPAAPLRFGLPAAGGNVPNMDMPVAQLMNPGQPPRRRPCGGRFRQKAVELSNSFRKVFGFPLIETEEQLPQDKAIHGGAIRILPFIPEGGASTVVHAEGRLPGGNWFGKTKGGERVHIVSSTPGQIDGHYPPPGVPGLPPHRVPPHRYHHHNHGFRPYHDQPFLTRVQNAILSLGPWEGRAVAFVLGCGIGVLLRMFFVLSVVTYRAIRGYDDEEDGYVQVTVFDEEEEDDRRVTPVSAPPAYVYPIDEKIAVEDTTTKPQTTEN